MGRAAPVRGHLDRRSRRPPAGADPRHRPRSGFGVAETVPGTRLTLAGRHRFSRYTLIFELRDAAPDGTVLPDSTVLPDGTVLPAGTVLTATTRAAFPGTRGQAYRALVIGTRAHVLATRHLLHAVRRLSLTER
jgi:hypothetical protein